ncbi:MAG: penicillin-binding transpeptidase domain-containing protein [Eubacteriales bacterium]|nr:penicillin-binding transpeptidase domain-containing protein [Eubacteriales bacterium]
MNKLRRSLYTTGVLIIALFLFLSGWFGYTVYSQGSRWTVSQYNQRLTTAKKNTAMGDITDRYGVLLATTDAQGERRYNADEALRRSVSQTVGDQLSMSGTGVESYHANLLTGFSGSVLDRMSAALTGKSYTGDNITLTIDANLCRYISEAFPVGYQGAVCVINYKTGEVLAMVSKPDYDPQALLESRVFDTEGSSYFNRCLQGQYTPGSIFKVITLASALEHMPGIQQQQFHCTASRAFGDTSVTCQSGALAHGDLSLQGAFTRSCNCSFATITCALGAENLRATAEAFGFGERFSFADLTLYASNLTEDLSDIGALAWTGVGQGETTVTPLHMAMTAGAIANGGMMMEPLLLLQAESAGGIPRLQAVATEYRRVCSQETAATLTKYMYKTVESGTGTRAQIDDYAVCGKTGSAETSEDKSIETNAWFIGFLAEEEYPYAVSVVIEQGGAGGNRAASLAASTLKRAIALTDARAQQAQD